MVDEVTEQSNIPTWTPEKSILLLVEGEDDKVFFEAFRDHLSLQDIQVEQLGGKTNWRRKVKLIKDREDFLKNVISLGLVRDADTSPSDAFKSVVDALREAELPLPSKSLESVGSNPKVTVLILPDENEEGELKDLYLKSVEKDPAMPCVNAYFECLEQTELSLPSKLCKPKVQAFLASRQKEVIGIRRAAKVGYVPWEDNAFQKVKVFLKQISELY
ncbi:hypothetical protein C5S31_11930 [ANME-1 cluster archaeon GoMg2]|nr:hypothetical protein [ANME-1 cluster archaeon GoMg2]